MAEFSERPKCGTGPMAHVRRDKPLDCAARFRCRCGRIEHIVPYGIGMDALSEIWNDYVRQHVPGTAQTAMVDAIGKQFGEGREVGIAKAASPMTKGAQMNAGQWDIGRLKPLRNNSRVHDEKNLKAINASIDRFDWLQPIVVDKDGVIIMGHGRLEAAKQLNMEKVPVLVADWLTENEVAAAREADNMTRDLSFFDIDLLNENLEQIDWLDRDMTQFGLYLDGENHGGGHSQKTDGLFYEPSGIKPSVYSLVDVQEHQRLCDEIDGMGGIGEDERWFPKLAACRFLKFDYEHIADYYCESDAESQEAMEALKSVIIDNDGKIEDAANDLADAMEAISRGSAY